MLGDPAKKGKNRLFSRGQWAHNCQLLGRKENPGLHIQSCYVRSQLREPRVTGLMYLS